MTMLAILLMVQGPTLGVIEAMPPHRAGDAVLHGHDHAPIVAIVVPPMQGLEPPDTADLDLVERATVRGDACVRQRWRATFRHAPAAPRTTAILTGVHATTEAALPIRRNCAAAFVHLNGTITPPEAAAALRHLEALRKGSRKMTFACTDTTGSRLCDNDRTIRDGLRHVEPWAAMRRGGETILWLDQRGGIVTEVRFATARPTHVAIERRIPAPA